jgi:hypothetical protein
MMAKSLISIFRWTALAAVALLAAACSTYPKTYSNESPVAQFGQYQTFNFASKLGTDRDREVRSLLTQYLVAEISAQMQARGYVYAADNADVSFNFDLVTQEKIRSTPSAGGAGFYGWGGYPGFWYPGFGPGFGYGPGFYGPGVGWGGAWGGGWGGGQRIIQYTEGSLYVTIIDNSTRGVVWEGMSVSKITDEVLGNLGLSVKNAVQGMFEQFPYTAAGRAQPARLERLPAETVG